MNKLLEHAKKISEEMQSFFGRLGEVLLKIKNDNIYEEIGYSSFVRFCEGELNCTLRTVVYKQKLRKVNEARKTCIDSDALNKIMDDLNFIEDPILYLKNIRVEDKTISDILGINVGTIRNNTKYVRCILPIDVYLKAFSHAKESNITVEQEISDALTILYRGEDKVLSRVH